MESSPDVHAADMTPLFVQATLIFLTSDHVAVSYFYDHRDEVQAITGLVMHVVVPERARSPEDVNKGIDSERYPGLKAKDIPCLWIEASVNEHFIARLPSDVPGVKGVLFGLVDSFRHATTFADGKLVFMANHSASDLPAVPAKHVVISIHGFNTRAAWQKQQFQTCLDEAGVGFQHRAFDFSFVGVLGLLFPPSRRRKVEWFLEEYQRLVYRENLHDSLPSIVAHSYGTYIVARAMEKYPDIRFRRIIFCGSIVNRDYDWGARVQGGQVERVLNDYGRMDFWARVAEWVISDGGSAGTKGFSGTKEGTVVQREHRYWRHSDYFYDLNYRNNWIPFLARQRDPAVASQSRERKRSPKFYVFATALLVLAVAVLWALSAVWRFYFGP